MTATEAFVSELAAVVADEVVKRIGHGADEGIGRAVSLNDAAERLSISVAQLRRLIERGEIPEAV